MARSRAPTAVATGISPAAAATAAASASASTSTHPPPAPRHTLFASLLRASSILASIAAPSPSPSDTPVPVSVPVPGPAGTARLPPTAVSVEEFGRKLRAFERELRGWATVFDGEAVGEDDGAVLVAGVAGMDLRDEGETRGGDGAAGPAEDGAGEGEGQGQGQGQGMALGQGQREWKALYEQLIMRALWVVEQIQAGLVLDQATAAAGAAGATVAGSVAAGGGKEKKDAKDGKEKGKGKAVEQRRSLELGTKDMQHLRTLLTLIFQHLAKLLQDRLLSPAPAAPPAAPPTSPSPSRPSQQSAASPTAHSPRSTSPGTSTLRFYPPPAPILRLLKRIFALLYTETDGPTPSTTTASSPGPGPGPGQHAMRVKRYIPYHTHVSNTVFHRHTAGLLAASIILGWAPAGSGVFPGEGKQGAEDQEVCRERAGWVLHALPISQGLAALGTLMSVWPAPGRPMPMYAKAACKDFMSALILQPGGPRALMDVMFGERAAAADPAQTETQTLTITKLEKVALTLSAVPSRMTPEAYYALVLPRLMAIVHPSPSPQPTASSPAPAANPNGTANTADQLPPPPSHVQAAAFTISRMIRVQRQTTLQLLLPTLHGPFLPPTHPFTTQRPAHGLPLSASLALTILTKLLTNSDPSPVLFGSLLTNILPPLWSLHEFLAQARAADPVVREMVQGLVGGWARVVGKDEALAGWGAAVELWKGWGYAQRWEWAMGADGPEVREAPPAALRFGAADGDDAGAEGAAFDPLEQHPDPKRVVDMFKAVGRKDVSAEFFVRMLDKYGALHAEQGDTADAMLYLQYVVQMADTMGPTILERPEHVLAFILHSLESTVKQLPGRKSTGASGNGQRLDGKGQSPFRIVKGEDSDDEDAGVHAGAEGDEEDEEGYDTLASTAVTLLLAVLEANDTFPPSTIPVINSIYDHLDPLTSHPSTTVAEAARDARLVLTARRAASMRGSRTTNGDVDTARQRALETYQEALRLVQDPILPVRAHGLTLLRQLVSPPKKLPSTATGQQSQKQSHAAEPELDAALLPGILDVFITAVQDDDSYVYMNAVHGLAAMLDGPGGVHGMGSWVFRSLVELYVQGLETDSTIADLDKRVRIGEAISQAVLKIGPMVSAYVQIIIPAMFSVTRTAEYPTVLRASALSIISQCTNANPLALLPFYADIASALLDLLSIETVTAGTKAAATVEDKAAASVLPSGKVPDPSDLDPTMKDPKLPAFRRSAAHLLAVMLRSAAEKGFADELMNRQLATRMVKVLRYIRDTDVDVHVRAKAREALEVMDDMVRVKLGLSGR